MQAQDYAKKRLERMGMDVERVIVHTYVKKTEPGITMRVDRDAVKSRVYKHFADIKVPPVTPHAFFRNVSEKKSQLNKSFDPASLLKKK